MEKSKGFIAEFRKFITRGNVLDMAVGVIVGGAFTSIVNSLNTDILTPILAVFGGTDFSYLTVTLGQGENAPVLCYGNFITAIINFLITALVIFCLIKGINTVGDRVKKLEKAAEEKAVKEKAVKEKAEEKVSKEKAKKEETAGEEAAKEAAVQEAASATKKCPYCLSEIPAEAVRCPHCTSHLEKNGTGNPGRETADGENPGGKKVDEKSGQGEN